MQARLKSGLHNHAHVLLIVPLVVIVTTWPTFARIFDGDVFWLHTGHADFARRIWDAWHIEKVLAGKAELFYTDSMFHPQGLSLAFEHYSLPHALLFIVFNKFLPADSAYNLLFLMILCINGYCTYPLILHLIGNKWIALFGAVVVSVSVPFLFGSTVPDLIIIGTIPLSIYFFHRHFAENRRIIAALAGLCAGVTALIGVYNFVFNLMTLSVFAIFLAFSHWKQRAFWRGLLLCFVVCILVSSVRFFPMFIDATVLQEGLEMPRGRERSNDVLDCCVLTGNPFIGDLFRKAFTFLPDSINGRSPFKSNEAYLGYINLFFLLCAVFHKPHRRRLAPWLAVLIIFAILRLGHFLTINGQEYRSFLLPEHFLSEWFPALFGSIYIQEYYQYGVILPLAVLACFGLSRLVRSTPVPARVAVVILSVTIVVIEFYKPPSSGMILEREKTAYNDWLSTESDSEIKLINLPRAWWNSNLTYRYLQTLNDYPTAFGNSNRLPDGPRAYIRNNAILTAWNSSRSPHCLPHNERDYASALEQLLADGFTHVVVHNWHYGDQFIIHSFRNVIAAYDNGSVSVYRLRDLRRSCDTSHIELTPFRHFATSQSAIPGLRSSILSFHPSESIDEDLFTYLASLFSDWRSLLHLHMEDDEPVIQSAGTSYDNMSEFAQDNQVIFLLYNNRENDAESLRSHLPFDGFELCHRDAREDGSVIEHYLLREFSCELVAGSEPLQVDYDNGARLVNALLEVTPDFLDVQLMWSNLPSEPHSISLQVFDDAGVKVLGQDSTIGYGSLGRHRVDISSLPAGNYVVKLIVYNFNTRISVPGVVSDSGARFERELEIATIDRS
ncbi:MAG: hypothetical protein OXG49_14520 [Chloroflexi bacterium]|nr:hypothetical protein [Chloroflexota bacterium]